VSCGGGRRTIGGRSSTPRARIPRRGAATTSAGSPTSMPPGNDCVQRLRGGRDRKTSRTTLVPLFRTARSPWSSIACIEAIGARRSWLAHATRSLAAGRSDGCSSPRRAAWRSESFRTRRTAPLRPRSSRSAYRRRPRGVAAYGDELQAVGGRFERADGGRRDTNRVSKGAARRSRGRAWAANSPTARTVGASTSSSPPGTSRTTRT
jgi:hypothetical protein